MERMETADAMSKSNSDKQKLARSAALRSQLAEAGGEDSCFDLSALPCPTFAGVTDRTDRTDTTFCWCPQSLPAGRSVHLASSRLSQQLESFPAWFDAMRTFGCSVNSGKSFLITAQGTTTDRFVKRIGELFDIPVVCVERFPKRVTEAWIERQRKASSECDQTIWIEPASDLSMDALLIAIASEVRVLRVRNKGNVHQALTNRLESTGGQTWMLIDATLTKSSVSQPLIDAGATGWWLYESNAQTVEPARTPAGDLAFSASVTPVEQVDSSEYVIHWTRRRHGAWPDQSDPAYLDDLIFRRDASDHQALSSLRRILMTQRIIASNDLTRAARPVVCFADVRLTEIEKRRTFRSHLGRWDFEPYGIAIRKDCLKRLGARPVIYGDDSDWEQLADADRPYFQLAVSKDGELDWQTEQESRVCGDLSLKQFGPDEAVVFVPSKDEADLVAPLSRWPVVVLG